MIWFINILTGFVLAFLGSLLAGKITQDPQNNFFFGLFLGLIFDIIIVLELVFLGG